MEYLDSKFSDGTHPLYIWSHVFASRNTLRQKRNSANRRSQMRPGLAIKEHRRDTGEKREENRGKEGRSGRIEDGNKAGNGLKSSLWRWLFPAAPCLRSLFLAIFTRIFSILNCDSASRRRRKKDDGRFGRKRIGRTSLEWRLFN